MPDPDRPSIPDSPNLVPTEPSPPSASPAAKSGGSSYTTELPLPEELQASLGEGYVVESFLGQGGMGAVYKGVQMPLGRPVAIKILAKQGAGVEDDFAFEERFKREAYAMAALTHPHIVQVYDCGDAGENYLFISMELVEGGDLSDAIKSGVCTPEAALKWIPQICEGMQAAHDRGLVHRDIKPANIFLTRDGRAKVADFGLAKKFDTKSTFVTKTGMGMGTPDYAAPEQYDAIPDLDHRADIYALGVMMYQMLTGRLPRGSGYKTPSQITGVDARIDAVVAKAMASDRDDRYQSTAQIAADLAAILSTPPVREDPTAKPTPAPARVAPGSAGPAPRAGSPTRRATPTPRRIGSPAFQKGSEPPPKKRSGALMATFGMLPVLAVGGWFVLKPKQTPVAAPTVSATPAAATKEAPFMNSLGMQFVPVPIIGGPTDKQRLLFSIWDTRVQDYEVFVTETKRSMMKPEFEQGPTHPAVMVSWDDAQLFCKWLTERERSVGKIGAAESYRLPTDHEWSCAAGIGAQEDAAKPPGEKDRKVKVYPWEQQEGWPPPENAGNYGGEEIPNGYQGYRDAYVNTSPVGTFAANPFGLFDMSGNVYQWCEEEAVVETGKGRVLRGVSWSAVHPSRLMWSGRVVYPANHRRNTSGFRCVLAPSAPATAAVPAADKN